LYVSPSVWMGEAHRIWLGADNIAIPAMKCFYILDGCSRHE
jgi:hypothetical protein